MYGTPLPPEVQADTDSAKTLALVALILYGVFGTLIILVGILVPFLIIFGIIPIIFLLLAYVTVYTPLTQGRPGEARTPALVLGIISLFIGGVISGILLIVAYAKANSAHVRLVTGPRVPPAPSTVTEATPTPLTPRGPAPEGAETTKPPEYCPSCGVKLSPEYRFCNNCGTKVQ